MKVARGANTAIESYAAFTQRQRVHQRAQYAPLSFAEEQRRLKIHLRRILLLHNGSTGEPVAPPGEETTTTTTRVPWSEWRAEAIAREARKARRQASAQTIQRVARRWAARRRNVELPSTSEWIAVVAPAQTAPRLPSDLRVLPACVTGTHESELPATLTEPFQVIVELLGARDLALSLPQDGSGHVSVAVRLVNQPTSDDLGRLEAFSSVVCAREDLQWDDHVLQVGMDTAEKALLDGAVQVDVLLQVAGQQTTSLGHLTVALDLLETSLADKYAMTRWFPLERGRGAARQAKGELRLGIRLLMRNPNSSRCCSDDVWTPFQGAPPTPPPPSSPHSHRSGATRGRKRVVPAKPPLSPRRRDAPPRSASSLPRGTNRQPASRIQYARAEAMSPPSSPSSDYSSDSNAEFSPQTAYSPSPRAPRASLRRASTSGSSGGIVSAATTQAKSRSGRARTGSEDGGRPQERSLSPQRDAADTSDEPAKPLFLKRKPYKVVFQKLDWSRVSAKTDSNWGTSGTAAGSGSSPRRSRSTSTNDPTSRTRASPSKTTTATSEHLAAVAHQVYAACHVTKDTAALAQMRFRRERRQWLLARLPPPARPKTDNADLASPGHDTAKPHTHTVDDASLHALWMELQSDADGATYAALLHAATATCT